MYLQRQIETTLKESIKEFPVIAVMGPRQVGKSTLLKQLFQKKYKYITFDDLSIRSQAQKEPALFLKNNPGKLIIDEIQYAPEILSELKINVDKSGSPGQYLLTGSQQFQLIRGMQETLAGRVLLLNLPAMTVMEKAGFGNRRHWLPSLLDNTKPDESCFYNMIEDMTPVDSLLQGGLPGILTKSRKFYPSFFDSYIKTYIERDIPAQYDVKDMTRIANFLKLLAPQTSCEINKSQLGRELGISPPTSQRWLEWLKATFVWNEHPPYHGNMIKRVSRHPKGFMFDTGVICNLLHIYDSDSLNSHPFIGNIFETAMRIEIQSVIQNLLLPAECFHWRTPYGYEVDIVIEYKNKLFALECKWGSNIQRDDFRNLYQFKKNYGDLVAFMGIITPYGNLMEIGEGIWQLPWFIR